jgi:hypothetical protein
MTPQLRQPWVVRLSLGSVMPTARLVRVDQIALKVAEDDQASSLFQLLTRITRSMDY